MLSWRIYVGEGRSLFRHCSDPDFGFTTPPLPSTQRIPRASVHTTFTDAPLEPFETGSPRLFQWRCALFVPIHHPRTTTGHTDVVRVAQFSLPYLPSDSAACNATQSGLLVPRAPPRPHPRTLRVFSGEGECAGVGEATPAFIFVCTNVELPKAICNGGARIIPGFGNVPWVSLTHWSVCFPCAPPEGPPTDPPRYPS